VVRSKTIDEIGPMGMWKYRSMMAKISEAYAALAPEEDRTL